MLLVERGNRLRRSVARSQERDALSATRLETVPDGPMPERGRPGAVLVDLRAREGHPLSAVEALAKSFGRPVVALVDDDERRIVAALKTGVAGCLVEEDLDARVVGALLDAAAGGAPMSRRVERLVVERARRDSSQMRAVRPPSVPPAAPLGPRRRQILEHLAQGLSYEQIALAQGISVNTVRTHVRELYGDLGASTKVEAVLAAIERGLLKQS